MPVPATKLKFFPLPERFYWNYAVLTTTAESFQRSPDSSGVSIPLRNTRGRTATIGR